jgi:hypothetical protein
MRPDEAAPLKLAVIWSDGRWTLLAPKARYNRYASRQSALAAAQRLARLARAQGRSVEILLQDAGGELSRVAAGEDLGGPPP